MSAISRVLLYHPEMGVYLDDDMGHVSWSLLEPAEQWMARTWADRAALEEFLSDLLIPLDDWEAVPVMVQTEDHRATIRECVKAGMKGWNPDVPEQFKK
jgi:hypothetical protein